MTRMCEQRFHLGDVREMVTERSESANAEFEKDRI